jgi:conjugal transfer pilin signal peptidase TrbI
MTRLQAVVAWGVLLGCIAATPFLSKLTPGALAPTIREYMPVQLALDFHQRRCLEGRAWIVMTGQPETIRAGDLITFDKPSALSYLREDKVLKMVAGVPGDRLQIVGDEVKINGRVAVRGLELAEFHKQTREQLQRDEVIPQGRYFVIGTMPRSDDSRYWGYVRIDHVNGRAHEIF